MFKTRLLSGIVLVVIALVLMITGGSVLGVALGIISLIGMYELNRTVGAEKTPLALIGYVMAAIYYMLLLMDQTPGEDSLPIILFVAALTLIMVVYVFSFPKYHAEQVMTVFFGLIYVGVMMSYIYRIRQMDGGKLLVWLVFAASWGSDTLAYCAGMLFGKHKMSPKLSPKKTIEGGIGGVLGAGLIGVIFGLVFAKSIVGALPVPALDCAIICIVGALISMVGDLAASAIKRNREVKDYGKLIPGHGGILDRFDSVIFVAPAIYYTIILVTKGMSALTAFIR